MRRLFVSSSVFFLVLACGPEAVPPSTPTTLATAAPSGSASTSTGEAPLAPAPVIAEPAGIGSNQHAPPAAPNGKGVWIVDAATSSVKATVGPKSEKPLVMTF